MNANRQLWNRQHQALQRALARPDAHRQALDLFLSQHAMVHSAQVSQAGAWSFEDEVWDGLSDAAARCIPASLEHSVAWIMWHIARIEDVTMNLLVGDCPQVFDQGGWLQRTRATIRHTGNVMTRDEIAALSDALDLEALRAYRMAVGRRTREIVRQLAPADFGTKIAPGGLQRIRDQGDVLAAADEIVVYWSKRTKAGLLLMPATRHNFLHLNEATRIRQKCR